MDKLETKKNIKIFLFLYLIGYIIFNWSDISWIFNYKAVSGLTYDFFNPYSNKDVLADYYQNQILPVPTVPEIVVNNNKVEEIKTLNNIKVINSDKQNILEIPNIGLLTDIVFPQTSDIDVLHKYLDSGVIYYPGSVLPNQNGQIILLGHSAPPGWPKIKHDWVFSNLEKLNIGDEIYLNLNYEKYTYKIVGKKIINKGQEIENSLTNNSNVLVLVSCYPPGKDFQRIVVTAEITKN